MISRPHLIIPDADVIIDLHEMGIWDRFVDVYDIYLSGIVAEEAHSYVKSEIRLSDDPDDIKQEVYETTLDDFIAKGKITVIDLDASDMVPMTAEAHKMNVLDKIHDGEKETLAAVFSTHPQLVMCFKDRGAIECAVLVGLKEKCISVEKALDYCGLGRTLEYGLTEERFQKIVKHAEQERVQKLLL